MQTVITSKFQTTIPKKIREKLKLLVNDSLEWRVGRGEIILKPFHKGVLLGKNSIKTGPGNIYEDNAPAKRVRAEQES